MSIVHVTSLYLVMESPSVLSLLAPGWLLVTVAAVLLNLLVTCKQILPPVLRDALEYGKVKPHSSRGFRALFSIPKRWFLHFYAWGCLWTGLILVHYTLTCIASSGEDGGGGGLPGVGVLLHVLTGDLLQRECVDVTQYHFDTLVVLTLIFLHVFQRLCECLCVHYPSPSSQMHLLHYLYGLYFYTAVALTPLLHTAKSVSDPTQKITVYNAPFEMVLSHFWQWRHVAGTLLFLWASYQQLRSHRTLANLRLKPSPSPSSSSFSELEPERLGYGVPRGGWFRYVSSPHYLAEVVKYVGVGVCLGDLLSVWWMVPLVSFLVLAISARQTHAWYLQKFEDYPRNRRALIPFVF